MYLFFSSSEIQFCKTDDFNALNLLMHMGVSAWMLGRAVHDFSILACSPDRQQLLLRESSYLAEPGRLIWEAEGSLG